MASESVSRKYQAFRSIFDRLVNSVKPAVGEVARKAFSKNLISRENLSQAENLFLLEGDRASKLLSHILDKIEERETHFDTFVSILHSIPVLNDIASDLESRRVGSDSVVIKVSETPQCDIPSTPILRYAMYLKGVYKSATMPSDKFPHLTCTKFINLALVRKEGISRSEADEFTRATLHGHVDEILKKKEPIKLEEVLHPVGLSFLKCVYLAGAPGVGKSTCVWELCKRWDEINDLKKYSLVILVRLRDRQAQEAKNVHDLCFHESPDLRLAVANAIETCEGKGVLFILDGFDELPSSLRSKSLFVKLIQGNYLSHCTILVTSRPSATADVLSVGRPHISKQIEVVGFTQETIEEYAKTVFASQPDVLADFLIYISTNPAIRSMMYIPLNSAIVVEVYGHNRTSNRPIPQTMTQLYVEMSMTLLARHLGEDNQCTEQLPEKLEDLPPQLYQPLFTMARLAFEGLEKNELIFYKLPEGFNHFGFMNSPTDLYMGRKTLLCHSFLHLTLQEFFAAFYISQLSPSDQMKVFTHHRFDWEMIWRFVAGLTGFSGIGWEVVKQSQSLAVHGLESAVSQRNTGLQLYPFLACCLYEAQENVDCNLVLGESEAHAFVAFGSSALDCYAAGYCVASSNCMWKLGMLGLSEIGNNVVNMLKCGLSSSSKGLPRKEYANILELSLRHCGLNCVAFDQLASIIPLMVNLTKLDVMDNPAGEGGLVKLLKSIQTLTNLNSLVLCNTKLGHSDIECLSQLIKPSLKLKELTIGDPDTSTEVAEHMFKTVLTLSSLEKVIFAEVKWTKNAITLLKENKNLTELQQTVTSENTTSIVAISRALHKNLYLKKIKFEFHQYPVTNMSQIMQLQDPTVFFSSFIMPDDAGLELSEMLKYNHSLENLTLSCISSSCFSQHLLMTLNSVLQDNHTLKTLEVSAPRDFEYVQMDPRINLLYR